MCVHIHHRPFLHPWFLIPCAQPKMSYKDGFQKSYYVLESFEDGADKIRWVPLRLWFLTP